MCYLRERLIFMVISQQVSCCLFFLISVAINPWQEKGMYFIRRTEWLSKVFKRVKYSSQSAAKHFQEHEVQQQHHLSYFLFQISGLLILTFVVIVYSLFHTYPFWCCCKSEEECRKEELKNILEEKIRKHVQELQNESIERTMEEEVKPLLQNVPKNFWRDVDFKTAILKIKETLRNVFRYINIGTQEPTKPCVCI